MLADAAARLSRMSVRIVGHYTGTGYMVKRQFFDAADQPEEMFWLIKDDTCYGGRKGLLPLATEIVRGILS